MKLGNVEISTPKTQARRISMFLWGPSGAGKTTLACTAPGPILLLNLDPDGPSSLGDREDVFIADFSKDNPNMIMRFKGDNPVQLKQFFEEHPEVQTVVLDSVTSLSLMALKYGVTEIRGATVEAPTLQGYGRRNSYTYQAITSLIKITGIFDKNIILIAHEDTPQKDELTGQLYQSILIGGKLQEEVPILLSEVWRLEDTGKNRVVQVRSSRMRKPMKSRMFKTDEKAEFVWAYNADTMIGEGIELWLNRWVENGGRKLSLPK